MPLRRRLAFSHCASIATSLASKADAATTEAGAPDNEYGAIADINVYDLSGKSHKLSEFTQNKRTVLALLTHFGDFNAWEYAQQLEYWLPLIENSKTRVVAVGIGGVPQAKKFSELLELPKSLQLLADPTGSAARALNCSRGFGDGLAVNGYLKLFPMLLGVQSPGTLQAVLRGYSGDTLADRGWVDASLARGSLKNWYPSGLNSESWDPLGDQGLRPFELATLRLQNMKDGILANWADLVPSDDQLLVQQGGTVIFSGQTASYVYRDDGILTYTPMSEILRVLQASQEDIDAFRRQAQTIYTTWAGVG